MEKQNGIWDPWVLFCSSFLYWDLLVCPCFTKVLTTSRIILTIAVVLYTSYLIFASLEIARELYRRMGELQDALK
jgi:hypothetical protein